MKNSTFITLIIIGLFVFYIGASNFVEITSAINLDNEVESEDIIYDFNITNNNVREVCYFGDDLERSVDCVNLLIVKNYEYILGSKDCKHWTMEYQRILGDMGYNFKQINMRNETGGHRIGIVWSDKTTNYCVVDQKNYKCI